MANTTTQCELDGRHGLFYSTMSTGRLDCQVGLPHRFLKFTFVRPKYLFPVCVTDRSWRWHDAIDSNHQSWRYPISPSRHYFYSGVDTHDFRKRVTDGGSLAGSKKNLTWPLIFLWPTIVIVLTADKAFLWASGRRLVLGVWPARDRVLPTGVSDDLVRNDRYAGTRLWYLYFTVRTYTYPRERECQVEQSARVERTDLQTRFLGRRPRKQRERFYDLLLLLSPLDPLSAAKFQNE